MNLSDFYPSPSELISSEINVLKYLMNNTYIAQEQSTFAQDAMRSYNQNKSHQAGFKFFSYFDVCHLEFPNIRAASQQMPNLRLVVGAQIELKNKRLYNNISYCFIVCRLRAKHPSILRKFHFDVTVSDNVGGRRQQHPTTHIQYCGGMIPGMTELGFREEQLKHMHSSLSEPRIFFWPMSLALLIDMALHEFPTPSSLRFRESSEWRAIISSQEALVQRPFYQKCVQIIGSKPVNRRILADEFYVS